MGSPDVVCWHAERKIMNAKIMTDRYVFKGIKPDKELN